LLGSLHEFDPAAHAVAFEQMEPLDRYMLLRCSQLAADVMRRYEQFEFHRAYKAMNDFCVVDLSAVYLDLLKDRMYTFPPSSVARRSAQTAIWKITETLVRLFAPVLSFTCEEVWESLPVAAGREASVHLAQFMKTEEIAPAEPDELETWKFLFALRDESLIALEEERKSGKIGKSLEAKLAISLPAEELDKLKMLSAAAMKEWFNVSQVELSEGSERRFTVLPAEGEKCERCWNYRTDIGVDQRWPTVCLRCVAALEEIVPRMQAANAGAQDA
jgi:isoleucyl-tRNA synthetase